jgi:hypothetical protein
MLGLVLSAASLAPLGASATTTSPPTVTPSSTDAPTPTVTPEQSESGSTATGSTATSPSSDPTTTSADGQATGSATPAPSSPAAVQPKSALKADSATVIPTPTLTHDGLERVTTWKAPRFSYSVDLPHAHFMCRIEGPGRAGHWRSCPVDSRDGADGAQVSGSIKWRDLRPSHQGYVFTVYAYLPPSVQGATPERGNPAKYRWHQFTAYAPGNHVPVAGPSFNLPWGGTTQRRVSLTRVIRAINSMPGYKEAYPGLCPGGELRPGTIRITLYSLTDQAVANALVAARRRCVSVQVLMNNHLNRYNDPAWRLLEDGLGTRRSGHWEGSFAHRCSFGCDGSGVLHAKMYLFDSSAAPKLLQRMQHTVMVGSSNMTSNAARVQWNDLYNVKNNPDLYAVYLRHFNSMARDDGFVRYKMQTAGRYDIAFSPYSPRGSDPEMNALTSVHCTGASGAGTNGHSLVYINMHAWFGTRGMKFADQVRRMYDQGCYVRVLYSFMSYAVFKKLHKGTGSRMSVRRTLFSHDGHTAYLYSHFKNISVSGHVGDDPSARVVWTGSNNFTNDGLHFDEVLLRIASASTYRAYVDRFKFISTHKSSPIYANYSEPTGGGRAP